MTKSNSFLIQAVQQQPQYDPAPVTLIFVDLLTLKVVFESRVTWATSVPILVLASLFST